MGTIWNDSIIVTCNIGATADQVCALANSLGLPVSAPVAHLVNARVSVAVLPDGSKLGWPERERCDEAREGFKAGLRALDSVDWVHVRWGECSPIVVESSSGAEDEY